MESSISDPCMTIGEYARRGGWPGKEDITTEASVSIRRADLKGQAFADVTGTSADQSRAFFLKSVGSPAK